jgi:putative ABC transport system permease protein
MWSGNSLVTQPAVISTAVAAVILAEVAFIAAAAFATGIRRRLREIGLMGANGASPQHVRTSVVGEGVVVGVGGALVGSALGVLLLLIGRDTVQQFVYRRIDEFPLSVLDVFGPAALAVVACAVAAWVPARTAIGVPTLTALQGRVPVGTPKRWIIPLGLGFAAFGTLLLVVGVLSSSQGGGGAAGTASAVIGVIFMIGGVALLAGPLVAWVSSHSERFPITSRIVLRDSGRQRGRAAAAVAATMVILIAPIASLAGLTSSEASTAIYGLAEEHPQLLVKGRFDPATGATGEPYTESDLAAIQAALQGSTMAEFEVLNAQVEYPAELEARKEGLGENNGGWYIAPERLAIANDQLLALLDDDRLAAALASEGMVLIGVEERSASIAIGGTETEILEVPVSVSRFSFPRVLVTESVAETLSDTESRTFALFQRPGTWWENPFDSPLQAAYETELNLDMAGSGGDIAVGSVYLILFALTLIVVLIVVATVTGLSAAEADNDIRTVVAVGATNGIRRRYLGLQSGLHTLLGGLLALPLTLLLVKTVVALNGRSVTIGNFGTYDYSQMYVPWGALGLLVIGLPLVIAVLTAMTVRSAPTTPPRRAM